MKKINKKAFCLSLLSLGVGAPTLSFLVSCSSKNSSNNDVNNNNLVESLKIKGNTNLNTNQTLVLQPEIIWTGMPEENIEYKWIITKNDKTKQEFNQYSLNIDNIDLTYNGAKVQLTINLIDVGQQYSSDALLEVREVQEGDKICFKTNSVFLPSISNIEASTLWNNPIKIKELIVEYKTLFFNILDGKFNLENNLEILNIENNQIDSDRGILDIGLKVNNATQNNQSIQGKVEISGFKTKELLDQSVKDYDYFVLPGKDPKDYKNRITIPFTKNRAIRLRYGNVPLPWVDDNLITKDDLINALSYLCFYAKATTVDFGQRRINANLFITAFFEWCIKYHKYFPYKSFDNEPPYFFGISNNGEFSSEININKLNTPEYINNRTWYIYSIQWPNFDEIYQNGQQRDDFLRFVTKLFRYVQPNMSDVEKLFLCENFVMNWLYYDGKKYTPPFDNRGVCANYANLLSFALEILDVPSVPLGCGAQAQPHAITWTYLDLYGNGNKKWYASDMTWGDYDELITGNCEGIAGLALPNPSKGWYLFDVGISQFDPIDSINPSSGSNAWQHDISNTIYGLPWSDIGQNKSPIGLASYGKIDDYVSKYFSYLFNGKYDSGYQNLACIRSRVFYLNGYSYYFGRDKLSPNGVSLYRTKSIINSKIETVPINLDEKYMSKFSFDKENGNSYETTYPPLVQQFGNKIVILLNPKKSLDPSYQRSILLINTTDNGIDWKNVKEYQIPNQFNLNENYIFNMDIEWDGILRLDYGSNYYGLNDKNLKTIKVDLGQDFKSNILFNHNSNNRKGDLEIAKQYFTVLISSYRIGEDKNNYIPFNLRKEFFDFMDSQSLNTNNYYQSIVNIYNKYMEISSKIMSKNNAIIQSKLFDNIYTTSLNNFKQYGYNFGNFEIFSNPDDMVCFSNSNVSYNVYFSNKKPTSVNDLNNFTKVINNADHIYVDMSALEKNGFFDPAGYYYFEIISKDSKIKTNVCELQITNSDIHLESKLNFYGDSLPTIAQTRVTNYVDSIPNWYDDPISFDFQIYYNEEFKQKYDFNVELKYINVDTLKTSIIKNNDYFKLMDTNNSIKGRIDLLNKPDDSNHGIYYLEITTNNKSNNVQSKYYSNFTFIFTNNDYDNWQSDIWVKAIDTISIFKNNIGAYVITNSNNTNGTKKE